MGSSERSSLSPARSLAARVAGAAAGGRLRAQGAAPGTPANPIAPVALPKATPEAQAAFDEGVRIMKMGRKHYKEARKPLQRATELDGRLFEAWHNLGVIETALGNFDKAIETSSARSTSSPARARRCSPTARACAARTRPRRRRRSTPSG